jgi:hypothetical protein
MHRVRSALRFLVPFRHYVEARLGRRLPLPSFAIAPSRMPAFGPKADEEYQSLYRGRAAELFFANDGPVIHKWLHFHAIYDQLVEPFSMPEIESVQFFVSIAVVRKRKQLPRVHMPRPSMQ